MSVTIRDLKERAKAMIRAESQLCHDVADEHSQIFENVRHMRWFLLRVMLELTATVKRWQPLHDQVAAIPQGRVI